MFSCRFKFTWDCDEDLALLCDRSISPQWNRIINAQQEFSLTFTANQEFIRWSTFRAEISPAHIVCSTQEEDLAIFSVSYCIAYLNSFSYYSPRCSVSTMPVLCHDIRYSFSFTPAPPFAWFLFFTYYDKYNSWYSTMQFLQDNQYVCISCSQWTIASDYEIQLQL